MTDTPPSDSNAGTEESGAARAVDWDSLIAEWRQYGHDIVNRFWDRAQENVDRARRGDYDRDRWLDDVNWFWENVADDAGRGVRYARENMPRRNNDATE